MNFAQLQRFLAEQSKIADLIRKVTFEQCLAKVLEREPFKKTKAPATYKGGVETIAWE